MLSFVFLGIAGVTGFHALFTNCELMFVFAFVCIGVSLFIESRDFMPAWLRHTLTGVVFGVLSFIIYASFQRYQLYCGRLSEYGFLSIEALLAILSYSLTLLPTKQKAPA